MNLTDSVFVREFRDNWPILVTAFLCMFFAFSPPGHFMPILYGSVIDEFGWTREQATLLASAKYATGSVFAILAGRFIDIIGVRYGLIVATTIGGIAMVLFYWVDGLGLYYFAGFLFGVAAPSTMVAIKVMISRTFHAGQGTAMAFALLGATLGAAVVPVVYYQLILGYEWRVGTALMSSGIWIIALPLLIFFYRGRSAEHSAALSSADTSAAAKAEAAAKRKAGRREVFALMRTKPFWLIFIAVFSAAFVDQAFIQHSFLYLTEDLGLDGTYVSVALGAIGLIGIAARIGVGGFFDAFSSKGVSISYLTLTASALLALAALNPIVLWLFVVFRAVAHAAVLLDTTVLAKHTFGMKNLGFLLGIFTAAVNLGFMSGPWAMARMYDATGSYTFPFLVCVGISLFAAAVLLPLKPTFWIEMREKHRRQSGGVEAQAKA